MVVVEEIGEKVVRAVLLVETESQKGILVGKKGAMVREIGTRARPEVERLVGHPVFLELVVKVRAEVAPRPQDGRAARDVAHAVAGLPGRGVRLPQIERVALAVRAGREPAVGRDGRLVVAPVPPSSRTVAIDGVDVVAWRSRSSGGPVSPGISATPALSLTCAIAVVHPGHDGVAEAPAEHRRSRSAAPGRCRWTGTRRERPLLPWGFLLDRCCRDDVTYPWTADSLLEQSITAALEHARVHRSIRAR